MKLYNLYHDNNIVGFIYVDSDNQYDIFVPSDFEKIKQIIGQINTKTNYDFLSFLRMIRSIPGLDVTFNLKPFFATKRIFLKNKDVINIVVDHEIVILNEKLVCGEKKQKLLKLIAKNLNLVDKTFSKFSHEVKANRILSYLSPKQFNKLKALFFDSFLDTDISYAEEQDKN